MSMSHQKPTIANYKLLIRNLQSQKHEKIIFRISNDNHQAKTICKSAYISRLELGADSLHGNKQKTQNEVKRIRL